MLSAAESHRVVEQASSRARGGRFIAPLFFVVAFGTLNLGLHGLLAPATPLTSKLPFALNTLDDWSIEQGDWVWYGGVLKQQSEGLGLIVAPLELTTKPTRLHLKLGEGSGLSFAMQSARKLSQSHIVYLAGGHLNAIYIDTDGYVEKQVSLPVVVTGDYLTVTVMTEGETYSLLIDHQTVVADLPLRRAAGVVGLVAQEGSSLGGLLADATTVRAAAPDYVLSGKHYDFSFGMGRDWTILTGDWSVQDGALVQAQVDGVDHSLLLPDAITPRRVELKLRHLAGIGGAGVLLNAPSNDRLENAHLIRLSEDDGQMYLFWGYFDARRTFVIQGSTLLPDFDMTTQQVQLELDIEGNSFNIFLNGDTIAEDVYLYSPAGHVGLTSSERAVAFDSLTIQGENATW